MVTLPNTLTNGTTADASQVMANLNALNDGASLIRNANIASAAAIDKDKLAQKWVLYPIPVTLVDSDSGTSIGNTGATGVFTIAVTTPGPIKTLRLRLRSGQAGFICLVEWHVERMQNVDANPTLTAYLGSTQLGGQVLEVDTSDAYYLIANPTPTDNPLSPFSDLDELEFRIGKTAAGTTVTLAGVVATVWIKEEIIA